MKKEPLVSICIPTYQGEAYLQEALNSVREQTYSQIEVIISDDSSTDKTLHICREFAENATFPVYIHTHNPSGIGANWNNCLKNAKGQFIKFLFQDDVLFPGCVEEMLEVIKDDPETAMVACEREILLTSPVSNWQKNWLNKYALLQRDLNLPERRINYLDKRLLRHPNFLKDPYNKIGEPTAVLFRKTILEKAGYYNEDLKIVLDLEFYYRVLIYSKIAVLHKKLVAFRLHEQQASRTGTLEHQVEYRIFQNLLWDDFFWHLSTSEKLKLLSSRLRKVFSLKVEID